ncbi:MAG: HAD-IC family P-type ATPase [Balneolaceae bacterium]|nr:HAD-IC family P-type ATPase [Balneolaceae bacterium]
MVNIQSAKQEENLKTERWYNLTAEEVSGLLGSSAKTGLSNAEAKIRLERYGPNEIEIEKGLSRWKILLNQFTDPLIYILILAAFVTLILQDYVDSVVITLVVLINAVIGFFQEIKAQNAILTLSQLTAPIAHVIRDSHEIEIPGKDLVPGDIVLLTSGGHIAADMRIIQQKGLEVNESSLTGESLVVHKESLVIDAVNPVPGDQVNMLFAGTIVAQGRAKAIVVQTGKSTELGKIASSVKEIGITHTPLQEKVERMGNLIGLVIIMFSAIIAVIGIIHKMNPYEVFITVVAIAVSAIPEGLPVVFTITLAIGVRRMAKRQAIIRSLPAVETLGSTTIIGSDKTGTLTKNEMTVRKIWADGKFYNTTGTGYTLLGKIINNGNEIDNNTQNGLYQTLLAGTLANEAIIEAVESGDPKGDPTEVALHVSAWKGGIRLSESRLEMEEIDLLPFEPERKFMATLNRVKNRNVVYLKGAPEAVLEKCTHILVNGERITCSPEQVRSAATTLAEEGLRVLAMANREWNGDEKLHMEQLQGGFTLTGLQGMEDPVRPEAVESIRISQKAGIRVIMITGDHVDTAVAIGRKLGLNHSDETSSLEGSELDHISNEELDEKLDKVNIFARVSPRHKLRVVDRLKHIGHIVAVTGDGVNDAPALRAAHIGVAMGKTGTDVAREASDMVLADDNFATITAAIEEGRIVFSNIRKVTFFLLSTAVGEVIVILIAVLMNWPLPFIAVQILWINLVTNGLQDVALAFEPGEPGIVKRKPRPIKEGILTGRLLQRLGGVGLVLAAGTLGMFWWVLDQSGDLEYARTVAMTQMVVFQFFHVFNCRSLDRSLLKINFFSNKFLFISVTAAILAHLAVLYNGFLQSVFQTVPLGTEIWLIIIGIGSLVIAGGELDKNINRWRKSFIG